jgi:Putative prokaryotic signal transducing protein
MLKIDPEQERQRLAKLYEALSDQELQEVGNNRMALTDWAFEAVRAEMLKRGLDWSGKDMPLPSEMTAVEAAEDPGNRPVVLRRYRDMPAALVEKSVLEDAGIECFLQDDNVVRMDWLWSNAMGGIKLVVRQNDAEDAEKLLSQTPAVEPEDGGGNAPQV